MSAEAESPGAAQVADKERNRSGRAAPCRVTFGLCADLGGRICQRLPVQDAATRGQRAPPIHLAPGGNVAARAASRSARRSSGARAGPVELEQQELFVRRGRAVWMILIRNRSRIATIEHLV